MSNFFGTDGIRMYAADFTPNFLHSLVKGLVQYGRKKVGDDFKILIGGDTRESSEIIIKNICSSLESLNISYASVGVLPTPAINYAFYNLGFDFAIDVTASHNPYTDNGIKIFERGDKFGQKLSDSGRQTIESALNSSDDIFTPSNFSLSNEHDLHDKALGVYVEHLRNYLGHVDFSGLSIGIDCANGATSVIGADVFTSLGAQVTLINNDATYGKKINNACGSTHLESIRNLVASKHLDLGIAFDGDGDRVLMIDNNGEIVDGDQIIVILADFLDIKSAAVTVMANQGIFEWAKNNNVELEVTPVGDQNVSEAMTRLGIPIGGEQSGHVILPGESTGDGMLTALIVAKTMVSTEQSLSVLAGKMQKFPQVIINTDVTKSQKDHFSSSEQVKKLITEYESKIHQINGRLLVRPSGTENLIRVTMWGEDSNIISEYANDLANHLKEIL